MPQAELFAPSGSPQPAHEHVWVFRKQIVVSIWFLFFSFVYRKDKQKKPPRTKKSVCPCPTCPRIWGRAVWFSAPFVDAHPTQRWLPDNWSLNIGYQKPNPADIDYSRSLQALTNLSVSSFDQGSISLFVVWSASEKMRLPAAGRLRKSIYEALKKKICLSPDSCGVSYFLLAE